MPNDPVILLSYINTKLRDEFDCPEELYISLGISKEDTERKLSSIGYSYSKETNQYK
ncbi:MAG: DUF4250 domain-containing protein [Ruminococcus sp.]|nr:DUF4250 domain-containing protein [Ruminococcus sp.]